MPGYRTHKKVGVLASAVTAGGVFVAANITYRVIQMIGWLPESHADKMMFDTIILSAIIAAGAYFGSTMNSPDLDIPSAPYNSWGPLKYLWLPYQVLVRHRSPISHWPVLSTVVKFIYMFLVVNVVVDTVVLFVNLLFMALGWDSRIGLTALEFAMVSIVPFSWGQTWLFILGDIIGEGVHSLTDYLHGKRSDRYMGAPVPALSDKSPETGSIWRERRGV